MKKIVLLGASGTVGTMTLDVIEQHPDLYEVVAFSVGKNIEAARKILKKHDVKHICVRYEEDFLQLKKEYPDIEFYWGEEGLLSITSLEEADLVFNALQGIVGLKPTMNAIEHHLDIALANKETMVVAGNVITKAAKDHNVSLIPVDSEHSAIYQCLQGEKRENIKNLLITASGGSFRDLTREQLKDVTVEDALHHPNWHMGAKITIDSATMMNKGFEVIEAHWFFDVPYDHIKTILHRESIVHSMVEYCDHSVIAQLGVSDMRVPIQYALSYPDRLTNSTESLDLIKLGSLHFEEMDTERFPLLKLAYETAEIDGNMAAIMNGANEMAVNLFLEGKIKFLEIEELVKGAVENGAFIHEPDLDQLIESDEWGRNYVLNHVG